MRTPPRRADKGTAKAGPESDRKLVDINFVTGTEGKWIEGKHMLVVNRPRWLPSEAPIPNGLYDVYADEEMKKDLSAAMPERAKAMREALDAWRKGVRNTYEGRDLVKP